jgi:murein DD-endopeptidase MepM/ murein hydrolase activator NlpD
MRQQLMEEPDSVRRLLLWGAAAQMALPSSAYASSLVAVRQRLVQGGHVVLRTQPRATLFVDGEAVGSASAAGIAVVGFDRDAPARVRVESRSNSKSSTLLLEVARRQFRQQRVNGLPSATVAPTSPKLLERIAREQRIKSAGFSSRWDGDAFAGGFASPVAAVISSPFGVQRVLNGKPSSPHYGVDLAAPNGTPVRAPAVGLVSLAEPDLHFEGGLVLIDHGQGLVSAYLHLSEIFVRPGWVVAKGERIGSVGARGRATGPHLCWRLKWRRRNLDPTLFLNT